MAILGTNDTATVRVATLPDTVSFADSAATVTVASGWGGDAVTVQAALAELSSELTTNTSSISEIESMVTVNTNNIAALDGRVDLLSTASGIAINAISGLAAGNVQAALEEINSLFASANIAFFDNTTDGLAGTAAGQQFGVANADPDIAYDVYRHDAGPTATLLVSVPANSALADILIGDVSDLNQPVYVVANGSQRARAGTGILIPTGSTGANTQYWITIPLNGIPAGTDIGATIVLRTSTDFDTESGLLAKLVIVDQNDGSFYNATVVDTITKTNATTVTISITVTVPALARNLTTRVVVSGSAGTRTTDGYFYLESANLTINAPASGYDIGNTALQYREAAEAIRNTRQLYDDIAIVSKDTDWPNTATSIRTAVDSLRGVENPKLKNAALVSPGWYTGEISSTTDIIPQEHVSLIGTGPNPNSVVIDARQPAGTVNQSLYEGIYLQYNDTEVSNLSVITENARYAMHIDTGASGYQAKMVIKDANFTHFGADEWGAPGAVGIGQHDGNSIYFWRTNHLAYTAKGFSVHNNAYGNFGCYLDFYCSNTTCLDSVNFGMGINNNGSGVTDTVMLRASDIDGHLVITSNGWLDPRLERHYANRNNYRVYAYSCPPFDWRSDALVDTIVLHDAAGSGSKVTITENAASLKLFGRGYELRRGGVGLRAELRAEHAISVDTGEVDPGVSLAARLGDLSGSPLTLTMQFTGGGNTSISLDQNYTGQSNATIVAGLNAKLQTALGGSLGGRGFVIARPYENRAEVYQMDREMTRRNSDTTAILKGMAVKWDGGRHNVKIMTSADAVTEFAGIALDDAVAGEDCRFQFKGHINEVHLQFSGATSIAYGDTFEVSSTAGLLVEGATKPILRCVAENSYGDTFAFIDREY